MARTALASGEAYAVTAPEIESGIRRPNRARLARFADVADWLPLELFDRELTARRSFAARIRMCRITPWTLRPTRVLVLLEDSDLEVFQTNWDAFESMDDSKSREIAEFVRCEACLQGLVTRALVDGRTLHAAITVDPQGVATPGDPALRLVLPDPGPRSTN